MPTPIASSRVAVAHKGNIENCQSLKNELIRRGHVFLTDTDTEAAAILATHYRAWGMTRNRQWRGRSTVLRALLL
jgi:glucosamine--fructose-6-phosphate aminotransferase (isomerizing)